MLGNVAMLQARMESSRLPGKVLLPINGKPMIEWQIKRILQSKLIEKLVIVIPNNLENNVLNNALRDFGVDVYRGSLNNVFDRFYEASKIFQSETVIRLTADCPLVMPDMIDEMLNYFIEHKPDYLCNAIVETLPDGLDIEIFNSKILQTLSENSLTKEEKENVTLRIWRNPQIFSVANFPHAYNLGNERWTVDYPEDFQFIAEMFSHFGDRSVNIKIADVLEYVRLNPTKANKISSAYRNIMLKNISKESL
jgi:spore coat polysaccharide biosynthesis protein SpsF